MSLLTYFNNVLPFLQIFNQKEILTKKFIYPPPAVVFMAFSHTNGLLNKILQRSQFISAFVTFYSKNHDQSKNDLKYYFSRIVTSAIFQINKFVVPLIVGETAGRLVWWVATSS